MDREKWARLESILDSKNIKPIVAVIPNNQDENLKIDKEDKYFWNSVRNWQKKVGKLLFMVIDTNITKS